MTIQNKNKGKSLILFDDLVKKGGGGEDNVEEFLSFDGVDEPTDQGFSRQQPMFPPKATSTPTKTALGPTASSRDTRTETTTERLLTAQPGSFMLSGTFDENEERRGKEVSTPAPIVEPSYKDKLKTKNLEDREPKSEEFDWLGMQKIDPLVSAKSEKVRTRLILQDEDAKIESFKENSQVQTPMPVTVHPEESVVELVDPEMKIEDNSNQKKTKGIFGFHLEIIAMERYLIGVFENISKKNFAFDYRTCHDFLSRIVNKIIDHEHARHLDETESEDPVIKSIFEDYEHNAIRHSVSVCLIAVEIGMTLEMPYEKIVKLSMVSLLHDLVMFGMPENLLNNPGTFSEEERMSWKAILKKGYEHLSTVDMPGWITNIVFYNVRNHLDAKIELVQKEQFEFANIIELANSYEAITHRRPWRGSLDSFPVVSIILKSSNVLPQYLIKALFMTFSIFPPNSYVKLNNGEVGLVVGINKNHPLRPKVKVLFDSQQNFKKQPRMIDLKGNFTFNIIDPIPTAEVESWKEHG